MVNAHTGQVISSVGTGKTKWTLALAVDTRGRYLASGGSDGTLRWWRITRTRSGPKLTEAWTRAADVGWATAVAIGQHGAEVAVAGHRKALVFETQHGRRVATLWWGKHQCESALFEPDSRRILIAAGWYGLLRYTLDE